MQIGRLFEIVYLLLDRRAMTARELAARFEVSTRTIYRDVEALSQAGIPVYADRGAGGGIRLSDRFVLNKSVLTEKERRSILGSLRGLDALRPEEARPALEKLSALFGGEAEDWIEVDFSAWNPDDPVSGRFRLLREAIFARRVVEFSYSGMDGGTRLRAAEPMKLVFRGGGWYLIGWCRLREAYRCFKLTRMEGLTALREEFVRRPLPVSESGGLPEAGRPAAAEEYAGGPLVALTVGIRAEQAFRARDEFHPSQLEQQPDGGFRARFSMPGGDWLYSYLMTYGDALEVLEPLEVREELIRRYRAALERYGI